MMIMKFNKKEILCINSTAKILKKIKNQNASLLKITKIKSTTISKDLLTFFNILFNSVLSLVNLNT
jgi:hypothetical protein